MYLRYGSGSVSLQLDAQRHDVLSPDLKDRTPLDDLKIGEAFDAPIESPLIEEIFSPGDSVLLVVSDATRATASAQIVNLFTRRLIQLGISPADISIIFATGIHRAVTQDEKKQLLSPFIFQRLKVIDHNPANASNLIIFDTTARGTPVELNKALTEYKHVVVTGAIGFHYFAGFSGGRKSICPGLASARTVEATHLLAFDFEQGGRRPGVGPGLLDGNAIHEECELIAALIDPSFSINTVVDEFNRTVRVYAGHWRAAHRVGCLEYASDHYVRIEQRRDVVIVSCGGFPYDINLIQAHKALDMAAYACNEGGTIVMLAECREGLGRPDFLKWFDEKDSTALEQRLRNTYEVNGQTAWALLGKAERFRILMVSDLPDVVVQQMRMVPKRTPSEALQEISPKASGYILPHGAKFLPLAQIDRSVDSELQSKNPQEHPFFPLNQSDPVK